jgi:hypothetical protein
LEKSQVERYQSRNNPFFYNQWNNAGNQPPMFGCLALSVGL